MNDLLADKKIILAVTGSIAAYKSIEIARALVKRGAKVRVVMTKEAKRFVTPLTFEALTGHKVLTSFWNDGSADSMEHIRYGEWGDLILVAPATADFIAKFRAGQADTVLLALLLVTRAPIVIAPAMNVRMWTHTLTQQNVAVLKSNGVNVIEPSSGELACGWEGLGRLADNHEIISVIEDQMKAKIGELPFAGKKFLITAGATQEPIDEIRYLTNHSSGKTGIALATTARNMGADVTLIHAPMSASVPSGIMTISVISAKDMLHEVVSRIQDFDMVVMAAAVADFRFVNQISGKLKKEQFGDHLAIQLNPDILATLGDLKRKNEFQGVIVGFTVESDNEELLKFNMNQKLVTKGSDVMVGNLAKEAFATDTTRFFIASSNDPEIISVAGLKSDCAKELLNFIAKRYF